MEKKQSKTVVQGIRLPPEVWHKLRELWQAKGRGWFVALVESEHKRLKKG